MASVGKALDSRAPGGVARWLWLLIALMLAGVLASGFRIGQHDALNDLRLAQEVELRTRVQALEGVLSRQRAVATVLADDALVRDALADPLPGNRAAVSLKFDRLRDQTNSSVIYLLDHRGVAIAASNWDEATSFVGQDYSFRDYFSDALLRGEATQFAQGTVSHRPGLYLSHDVVGLAGGHPDTATEPLGVVVVKVEFDALERNWAGNAAQTFVTDPSGQVMLAGDPALRFHPMPIKGDAIRTTQAVPGIDWTMTMASSTGPARYAGLLTMGALGFVLTLLAVPVVILMRARRRAAREAEAGRRYRVELERAVEERTRALTGEMRERRAAEEHVARLQDEMVQANKLAALGQITAGVAHEVNQPLATIRLLAENGAAMLPEGQAPEVAGNLAGIQRMALRIGRITEQLRGFARKASGTVGPVSLREALEVAVLMTGASHAGRGIPVDMPAVDPGLLVMAETVRLEQILVNLLQNAQEALAGTQDPRIRIGVEAAETVRVTVRDNGPGLTPETAARLFTPFATSKPNGLGLGLVISQEIARDFGGDLRALPLEPGQGACFILELQGAI
ncbi:sensor histidine kinase [Paracoccus sp. KR1-242]|uniref:sensor histidine kinase n=1 Tax=Paracoccus sp. KR1-242 TaxID=3410028 RepID=UPI003BFD2412